MTDARKRRRWLPAAGLALALVPSALVDLPLPKRLAAERAPETLRAGELALAPPDLIADALRLEVAPRFEERAAAPVPPAPMPVTAPTALLPELTAARAVPEPSSGWLALLSLGSAVIASRGMRRCLRRHPHR